MFATLWLWGRVSCGDLWIEGVGVWGGLGYAKCLCTCVSLCVCALGCAKCENLHVGTR